MLKGNPRGNERHWVTKGIEIEWRCLISIGDDRMLFLLFFDARIWRGWIWNIDLDVKIIRIIFEKDKFKLFHDMVNVCWNVNREVDKLLSGFGNGNKLENKFSFHSDLHRRINNCYCICYFHNQFLMHNIFP